MVGFSPVFLFVSEARVVGGKDTSSTKAEQRRGHRSPAMKKEHLVDCWVDRG